jgi:hypothetical protein
MIKVNGNNLLPPPIPIKREILIQPTTKTKTKTPPPPEIFTMKSFEVKDFGNRILDNIRITLSNDKEMEFFKRNVGDEKYQIIISSLNNYNNDDSSKKYIDELIASKLIAQGII